MASAPATDPVIVAGIHGKIAMLVDGGYIVIRAGGNLRQRVTYQVPTTGGCTPEEIMQELRETIGCQAPRMGAQPHSFLILEDRRAVPSKRVLPSGSGSSAFTPTMTGG